MDRLRSPGGCPWDAEQTHQSLAPYLLEEAYELLEAIELDDLAHLREELGDVLLQVAFHSRLAEERPAPERFSIDDVAADLVAKLIRRHPHVFAGREVAGAADLAANWEAIKAAEKRRESVTDGVPLGQPSAGARGQAAAPRRRRPAWTPPRRPATISARGCSRWSARRWPPGRIRRRRCGPPPGPTGTPSAPPRARPRPTAEPGLMSGPNRARSAPRTAPRRSARSRAGS